MDKNEIKNNLIFKSNEILKKYNEPYVVDDIAIMNTSSNINFLGNMRVMVDDSAQKIIKELENEFNDYETLKIRSNKVVPCCEPPFVHISFNITINK